MTEFWNELLTRASWEKLQELTSEFDFILIGGWAAYLWTGMHKSKDIDIIVDYGTLPLIQDRYPLSKNDRLKRYEVRLNECDIDIYLPFYSKLALPLEDLQKSAVKVKGIRTVSLEALLILKQAAEIERRNSIKGQKDAIDILTILIHGGIDIQEYNKMLAHYDLTHYIDELIHVVKDFDKRNLKYLDMNVKSYADWKKKIVVRLRGLR
ncbi:MAG: hypothetical protein JSW28_07295 [Thermoplasmata archaeon]|nr:MAG: hypothetical protein JSW28_07295 [Thermoplasmata archaeon]